MESVADIRLQQGMEQELNKVEELLQSDSKAVLELIGERLTDWEQLVKATNDYPSALRIGDILEKLRQYWLSLSWYQWMAAQEDVDGPLMTTVLRAKGRVYIWLEMHQDALVMLKQVEERLREEGNTDSYDYVFTLQNIAVVHNFRTEHEMALEHALIVLQWLEERDDLPRASNVRSLVGLCYHHLQQFEQSYEYFTQAREGLEACKDYFTLARCWHNYAELMRDWGRMEEALAAWRMSHEMKKRTGDFVGQVNTWLSMGEYLFTQQDWHSALRYCTQAISLCHQYRLYDQEVKCLKLWAQLLVALGRYPELEVCASRANCLIRSVTKHHEVASLLQKIAEVFQQIGRNDLAEQFNMNAIQPLD